MYHDALHFGWTSLLGKPVAFPFGHGLSYSSFRFAWAQAGLPSYLGGSGGNSSAASLSVVVTNVGAVAGRETLQVYLTFPASATEAADEPRMLLRAFEKTPMLAPGAVHVAVVHLSARDLSVWDATVGKRGGWRPVTGKYTVVIGSSSRDPRLEAPLWVS